MKKDFIYILLVVALVVIYFVFPHEKIKVEVETEYIPGDTVTVVDTVTIIDTVNHYSFESTTDTLKLIDTLVVAHSAEFDLGGPSLGTSGTVTFVLEEFIFKDIEYRYPEFTKTVVDTLRITNTENPPMYMNTWFWTTVAGFTLLFLALTGGS